MRSRLAIRRSASPRRRLSPLARIYLLAVVVLLVAGLLVAYVRSGRTPTATPDPSSPGQSTAAPDLSAPRLTEARQFSGPSYGLTGHHATKDKNQTKLWYAGKSWWGVLLDDRSQTTRIFRWTGSVWRDTGVIVDRRDRSLSDVVWKRGNLYIGTRIGHGSSYLTHFRLQGGNRWVPVVAPRTIASGGSTTLSITVDSRDRVWAVFNRNSRAWITHSAPNGGAFAPEQLLPGANRVAPDDTSAVVALSDGIAVLWSDQNIGAFLFATRKDSEPTGVLHLRAPPVRGLRFADGHIHVIATRDGRILAAVKTSLGDGDRDPPRSPLIEVLERSATGTWSQHVVATTRDQMTRAQIVLSADERTLFLFAASPQTGGDIYLKVASAQRLLFAPGRGTRILAAPKGKLNDATTGRNDVSSKTGIVVLVSNAQTARYYTAELPIVGERPDSGGR